MQMAGKPFVQPDIDDRSVQVSINPAGDSRDAYVMHLTCMNVRMYVLD